MAEQIISIEDTSFRLDSKSYGSYDGFVIKTTEQEIKLGIGNGQSCCENWGYFITNDEPDTFIGADVLGVDIVHTCLEKEKAPKMYEGDAMFVNIETTKGTLQFTAYNEHNGYYGHAAVVVSTQLNHSTYL